MAKFNDLRLTPTTSPEKLLEAVQEMGRMIEQVATQSSLADRSQIYTYGWDETSASNLLTSGAYDGNAGFVGIAANKCKLILSSSIIAGDEDINLQRYVSGSYTTITTLRPGEENSITGVTAGDQLRVQFAMTDTSADVRAYNIQFRLEE